MAYCEECIFFKENKCENKEGKLTGIELSPELAEAIHDCAQFEEVKYSLTLKGCLYASVYNLGLSLEDNEIENLYNDFIELAIKHECMKYNEG